MGAGGGVVRASCVFWAVLRWVGSGEKYFGYFLLLFFVFCCCFFIGYIRWILVVWSRGLLWV